MRNRYQQVNSIFYFLGNLLGIFGLILLFPLILVFLYWGRNGENSATFYAFLIPSLISFAGCWLIRRLFKRGPLTLASSMIMCALAWLLVAALGALPFVLAIGSNYLNAYFEAMSGFTTTGITVYSGLDSMPYSILFWRSLTQWLGGLGILSFFLIIIFGGGGKGGFHHIFSAESHKISSGRVAPSLLNTLKILWVIYLSFTFFSIAILILEKMPVFDSVCHSLTALSTGGFSTHDASIGYYKASGHPHYKIIEYTLTFIMMLGGINFLIHYRVFKGDFKALWDNIEIRYWWGLLFVFSFVIIVEHFYKSGALGGLFAGDGSFNIRVVEEVFRKSIFQVMSILTTTGFGTEDIGSEFFGAVAKQLFLVMMVIGGCVGSTGGGFKVLRVAVLNRLLFRELFRLRVPGRASSPLVIDRKIVPDDETHRIAGLFFGWILFLIIGGTITALFTELGPWKSFSGMFSALGNIGPCYFSVEEMIKLNPVVKITYIFGMLAGRLEILPVLLLFSRRAWR